MLVAFRPRRRPLLSRRVKLAAVLSPTESELAKTESTYLVELHRQSPKEKASKQSAVRRRKRPHTHLRGPHLEEVLSPVTTPTDEEAVGRIKRVAGRGCACVRALGAGWSGERLGLLFCRPRRLPGVGFCHTAMTAGQRAVCPCRANSRPGGSGRRGTRSDLPLWIQASMPGHVASLDPLAPAWLNSWCRCKENHWRVSGLPRGRGREGMNVLFALLAIALPRSSRPIGIGLPFSWPCFVWRDPAPAATEPRVPPTPSFHKQPSATAAVSVHCCRANS